MIHYLDRAFCSAYGKTCATHDCYRAMNNTRTEAAKRWADGMDSVPVAYGDFSKGCVDKTEVTA